MTMGGGETEGTEADNENKDKDQGSDKHNEHKQSDNS